MPTSVILALLTITVLGISALADRRKTWQGVTKGVKMLLKLLPHFLVLVILVSVFLWLLPQNTLVAYLGQESGFMGMIIAAVLGALALIPGPIAYPLCGVLLEQGVSYAVLAVFITTLMMVGILTLPVETKYFGARISILRNVLCWLGALVIGALVGVLL